MYNGKTKLFITYHMNGEGFKELQTEVLTDKEFPTLNEALDYMDKVMPYEYDFDDGDFLDGWEKLLEEHDDVYTQYTAMTNDYSYFLALLTPEK